MCMKKLSRVVELEEDKDGNLILPIPQDMLDELGWAEGTVIDWKEKDGAIVLSKVNG